MMVSWRSLPPRAGSQIVGDSGFDGLRKFDRIRRIGMYANAVGTHANLLAVDRYGDAFLHGTQGPLSRPLRVKGMMLARDDDHAVVVIVEVGIIFGNELQPGGLVDLLVQGSNHAHERHVE